MVKYNAYSYNDDFTGAKTYAIHFESTEYKFYKLVEMLIQNCIDVESEREKRNNADGCATCRYVSVEPIGEPCCRCKRNHEDMWQADK